MNTFSEIVFFISFLISILIEGISHETDYQVVFLTFTLVSLGLIGCYCFIEWNIL